jgi:hypothetical protein
MCFIPIIPIVAKVIGERLAKSIGAKFLTLDEIIEEAHPSARVELLVFLDGFDKGEDATRKILASTVQKRLNLDDCQAKGYILYGKEI